MPRKPIVGGNWKCNPVEVSKLEGLVANYSTCAELLDKCDVYVCPSNLHVGMVYEKFVPGVMVVRIGASMYFANVAFIRDYVSKMVAEFSDSRMSVSLRTRVTSS